MLKRKQNKIISDLFPKNITHAFFDKTYPDNPEKILSDFGADCLIQMHQTHSTNIRQINEYPEEKITTIKNTDAILTNLKNCILLVKTADCLPVIYSDADFIAISHQGWRGTLENMAGKLLKKLQDLGSDPKKLKVALGPHIGDCCYDIPKEREKMFREKYPQWQEKILRRQDKKIFLNLGLLNFLQLIESGVSAENIDFFPFCTSCDRRYFSFRRDKKINGSNISLVVKK